jgi:ATP-dependent Clp protease ATP-binding subunit ClpC
LPPAFPGAVGAGARALAASDVGAIRREAQALAKERNERPTTTHVLVALIARGGLAAELLAERRVGTAQLTKAIRAAVDDDPAGEGQRDPLERLFARARELAERTRPVSNATGEAGRVDGAHVLLAVCVERGSAAHKTLLSLGLDVARLRASLVQAITGAVEPRRRSASQEAQPMPTHAAALARTPAPRMRPLPPLPESVRKPIEPTPLPADASPPSGAMPVSRPEIAPPQPSPSPSSTLAHDGERPVNKAHRPKHRPVAAPQARSKLVEPTRFDLDPRLTPTLAAIGRNLTAMAARGELDRVVGRDAEIERTLDVLAKRTANNPCLVGGAGVGKTAIAHGVAAAMVAATTNRAGHSDERIVVELPIGELLAGTGMRGALAERIAQVRREVAAADGRIVIFLDEIHALLGGEAGEEAESELKTALARGEMPCIGATTHAEFRRSIERDPALARRFSLVEVPELDEKAAAPVVDAAARVLERHHGVRYEDDARASAIEWTVRYVPSRALPDKAIAALDLAGARAKRSATPIVDRAAVAEVVAALADVPIARLLERDADRFLALESLLEARVVGHREPIARIARSLRRGAAGLRGRRPLLTALLLGPTGVGKTETAKALAEVLFHDETAMTRLDLSEYAEAHAVARLVGAPPGYVGHEDGGQLTEAVRRRPYQVVLLDEMEKAHRDVLESLLSVLDEGRMTDGRGRTVDFTNTVIILTSNLGAGAVSERRTRRLGFGRDDVAAEVAAGEALEHRIIESAKSALPPELYNRFDEVLVYRPLTRADALAIARMSLARLGADLLATRGIALQADDEAIEALLDAGGFDPSMGGRPIRREISRAIEAPLAELLLSGRVARGDTAWVTLDDRGAVTVDAVSSSPATAAE